MKVFTMMRGDSPHAIVELSYWDMARLMLGREVTIQAAGGYLTARQHMSFEAFNLAAPRAPAE